MAINVNLSRMKSIKAEQKVVKKYTILIVDDEDANLRSLEMSLNNEYNVVTAKDGLHALSLIKEDPQTDRFQVIISDQRMPKMTGVEFLKHSLTYSPQSIRIILTGFTDIQAIIDSINDAQIYRFLSKPAEMNDLLMTVKGAVDNYELIQNNQKLMVDLKTANNNLEHKIQEQTLLTETFQKFVPRQFLQRIAKDGLQQIGKGQVACDEITILFSDIRSFTNLAETMSAQEVFDFLNNYLSIIEGIITQHGGFVDKFIGDAVMALFDHPGSTDNMEAQSAVSAAIAMQLAIFQYNLQRKSNGLAQIDVGIGIHSGKVIIGTVGSETRMDTTAIGDAVNLASRLEGLTKYYQTKIIISSHTFRLLDNKKDMLWRELDFVRVKGKEFPISIFEIFNADEEQVKALKIKTLHTYHEGLMLFYTRDWLVAQKLFEECLEIFPADHVARLHLERCKRYLKEPPHQDWDGSFKLEHK